MPTRVYHNALTVSVYLLFANKHVITFVEKWPKVVAILLLPVATVVTIAHQLKVPRRVLLDTVTEAYANRCAILLGFPKSVPAAALMGLRALVSLIALDSHPHQLLATQQNKTFEISN